jgi:hypothetical protein
VTDPGYRIDPRQVVQPEPESSIGAVHELTVGELDPELAGALYPPTNPDAYRLHIDAPATPHVPSRAWTRETPREPGMFWARRPWAPEQQRMLRLLPGAFGLVTDNGRRLARTLPVEWLLPC